MAKRPGLGKGLEELLRGPDSGLLNSGLGTLTNQLIELPLSQITHNPQQPRHKFDEGSLKELAQSIKERGVVQPIIVRPKESGYELVAGERRWRAAQLAGLETIAAVVRDVDDGDAFLIAIVENLQREDLNPFEKAQALQRLNKDFGFSQEEIGDEIGLSRSAVANLIRLLSLDSKTLRYVADGLLEEGHARALLAVEDEGKRRQLADVAVHQKLTVRQVEARVKRLETDPRIRLQRDPDPDMVNLQRQLSETLGVLVKIKEKKTGQTGVLSIHYQSLAKLEEIIQQLRKT